MLAFRHGMTRPRTDTLELIGPRGIAQVMDSLKAAFGSKLLDIPFPLKIREIEPDSSAIFGRDLRVSFARTPHTSESVCVRIDEAREGGSKTVCYTGDTDYHAPLSSFFAGADLLISECSFVSRRAGVPHLSVIDAARIAAAGHVSRLLLSHFYFDAEGHDFAGDVRPIYDGELLIARDGMTVEL